MQFALLRNVTLLSSVLVTGSHILVELRSEEKVNCRCMLLLTS